MFAVVRVGSKQYKVSVKDVIEVEKIKAKKDSSVTLKEILLLNKDNQVQIGQPVVKNAEILCKVLNHYKGQKNIAFKYRRRKASATKIGHRQNITSLLVEKITQK